MDRGCGVKPEAAISEHHRAAAQRRWGSDAPIDNLLAIGDETTVTTHLYELLASGLGELLAGRIPLEHETSERTRIFNLVGRP
jgi:hypothetical protein